MTSMSTWVDRERAGFPTELIVLNNSQYVFLFMNIWNSSTWTDPGLNLTLKSFLLLSTLVAVDIDIIHTIRCKNGTGLSLQFCILYWMVGRSGNKASTLSYCFKDKKIIKI